MSELYLMVIAFFIAGILVKYYKFPWLLKGYFDEENKTEKDELLNKKCNYLFIIFLILSVFLLIIGFSYKINMDILWFYLPHIYLYIFLLLFNNARFYNFSKYKKRKEIKIVNVIFTIIIIIVTTSTMYKTKVPEISFNNDKILINGYYETYCNIDDIIKVELKNEWQTPDADRENDIYVNSPVFKGRFIIDDSINIYENINMDSDKYVYIYENNKISIISFKDNNKTNELYDRISKEIIDN